MGLLDAITADALPRDSKGGIVLEPYGRRGRAFILPADRLPALQRLQRRFFQIFIPAALVAAVWLGPWGSFAVFVAAVACQLIGIAYVTRRLEESVERPTASRAETVDRWMRALGRPTMWGICVVGALSAAGGIWLLRRGQHGFGPWFLTIYGTVVCLLYARKLYERRGSA